MGTQTPAWRFGVCGVSRWSGSRFLCTTGRASPLPSFLPSPLGDRSVTEEVNGKSCSGLPAPPRTPAALPAGCYRQRASLNYGSNSTASPGEPLLCHGCMHREHPSQLWTGMRETDRYTEQLQPWEHWVGSVQSPGAW